MAYVDLEGNKLVLKTVIAGPPKVGKTTRLKHIGADEMGLFHVFGSRTSGFVNMGRLWLESESASRPVLIECYEWHGPERADVRNNGLFKGLDGLVYVGDAREDRWVDTANTFDFLLKTAGKSRIQRVPSILVLGQADEGLLRLPMMEQKLEGPTWSDKIDAPYDDGPAFVEAFRLFGEVMLARAL